MKTFFLLGNLHKESAVKDATSLSQVFATPKRSNYYSAFPMKIVTLYFSIKSIDDYMKKIMWYHLIILPL